MSAVFVRFFASKNTDRKLLNVYVAPKSSEKRGWLQISVASELPTAKIFLLV